MDWIWIDRLFDCISYGVSELSTKVAIAVQKYSAVPARTIQACHGKELSYQRLGWGTLQVHVCKLRR